MYKTKRSSLIIPAAQANDCLPYELTMEQRKFTAAFTHAKAVLPELSHAIEQEISRLLTDVELSIELSLCQSTGLNSWLAEPNRLLLQCPVLVPKDIDCFVAYDYSAISHLVDLSLGGQLSKTAPAEDKTELSASELRISGRLALRQLQAIQQLLFKDKSVLPVNAVKMQLESLRFNLLPFKVRLLVGADVINWFIWLPLEFFVKEQEESADLNSAVDMSPWPHIPVKGSVEMLRKKVSLSQLQACLAGAILPIDLNHDMVLQLNQSPLFLGKVAEEANSLVFQITDIANKEK